MNADAVIAAAAHDFAAALLRAQLTIGEGEAVDVRLTVPVSGTKLYIHVSTAKTADVAEESSAEHVPPRWQLILDVLKGQPPRKGAWIAAKTGRNYDKSTLRADLPAMVRAGLLVKGGGGYRRSDNVATTL